MSDPATRLDRVAHLHRRFLAEAQQANGPIVVRQSSADLARADDCTAAVTISIATIPSATAATIGGGSSRSTMGWATTCVALLRRFRGEGLPLAAEVLDGLATGFGRCVGCTRGGGKSIAIKEVGEGALGAA